MGAHLKVAVSVPSLLGSSSGQVTDVWHAVDGVRVEVAFPLKDAPLLPVGRAGELSFERLDTGQLVTALGKVAFRGENDGIRTFHFLFGERTRQSLASLLEPRRANRVHPDADEPVEVTLVLPEGLQKAVIGVARDVSATGIGIDMPWENEAALSRRDSLTVRLRLPTHGEELEFVGEIRNRSLGQGAIIYGIEFRVHDLATDDPRRIALAQYVSGREALESSQRRAA